jgi:hypothetical protein
MHPQRRIDRQKGSKFESSGKVQEDVVEGGNGVLKETSRRGGRKESREWGNSGSDGVLWAEGGSLR